MAWLDRGQVGLSCSEAQQSRHGAAWLFSAGSTFLTAAGESPCAAWIVAVRQNNSFPVGVVQRTYFGHFREGTRGLERVGIKRASGM
jgi:hypothetical protein